MKELTKEFKKQFKCLGENTERYISFTVSTEKEVTRIDKNEEEVTKNIYPTYYNLLKRKSYGNLIIKSCQ